MFTLLCKSIITSVRCDDNFVITNLKLCFANVQKIHFTHRCTEWANEYQWLRRAPLMNKGLSELWSRLTNRMLQSPRRTMVISFGMLWWEETFRWYGCIPISGPLSGSYSGIKETGCRKAEYFHFLAKSFEIYLCERRSQTVIHSNILLCPLSFV